MTWNADIADEDKRRRKRDRGRIAEYVVEINNLLGAMGMGDNDCDMEAFISPPEEDQVNVILTLLFFWSQIQKEL